jgi:hypothetical protein
VYKRYPDAVNNGYEGSTETKVLAHVVVETLYKLDPLRANKNPLAKAIECCGPPKLATAFVARRDPAKLIVLIFEPSETKIFVPSVAIPAEPPGPLITFAVDFWKALVLVLVPIDKES